MTQSSSLIFSRIEEISFFSEFGMLKSRHHWRMHLHFNHWFIRSSVRGIIRIGLRGNSGTSQMLWHFKHLVLVVFPVPGGHTVRLMLSVALQFFLRNAVFVLDVLLVAGVEVVKCVDHNVLRINRLLQIGRDALQRDGVVIHGRRVVNVRLISKGKPETDGCEEHFNADDEVLVSCSNCTNSNHWCAIIRINWTNNACSFQNSQQHTYKQESTKCPIQKRTESNILLLSMFLISMFTTVYILM